MEATRQHPLDVPASAPDDGAIAALAASLTGSIVLPGDDAYETVRFVHNTRYDRRPGVVVRAADAADVARAVSFAAEHDLEIAVRSGGHSLSGHGTSDGGVVIDLSPMKGLLIDPDRKLAWAQPGLTAGDITVAAAAHGLAVPFGDSASVGIGGLTTGGGIGFLVRRHGLTIDNLVGAEIVTADGRILTVDDDHHADLFWAIRGGGGNVGIVTRFVYRLVDVGMVIGGGLILPGTPDAIAGLMAAARQAPEELTLISFAMKAPPLPFLPPDRVGQLVVMALGVYAGDDAAAGQAAWNAIRAVAEPIADLVGPMPYPAIYQFTAEASAPGGASIRSWFTDEIDAADAEQLVAFLEDAPGMAIVQLRELGGAMARVAPEATAFSQRSAGVLVAAMSMFDPAVGAEAAVAADAWAASVFAAFAPKASGVYVNFLGPEGEARTRSAYPNGAFERLAAVKRRYDPANRFRLNQNVKPA
jgi:FAD/FMN-containing dehydrogenase